MNQAQRDTSSCICQTLYSLELLLPLMRTYSHIVQLHKHLTSLILMKSNPKIQEHIHMNYTKMIAIIPQEICLKAMISTLGTINLQRDHLPQDSQNLDIFLRMMKKEIGMTHMSQM